MNPVLMDVLPFVRQGFGESLIHGIKSSKAGFLDASVHGGQGNLVAKLRGAAVDEKLPGFTAVVDHIREFGIQAGKPGAGESGDALGHLGADHGTASDITSDLSYISVFLARDEGKHSLDRKDFTFRIRHFTSPPRSAHFRCCLDVQLSRGRTCAHKAERRYGTRDARASTKEDRQRASTQTRGADSK